MRRVAIITGASSGVGREFARQLDQGAGGELDELWLVARRREVLEEMGKSLSTPVRVIPLDLTRQSSYEALSAELGREDTDVRWLVNSAGFGKFGDFREIGEEETADMVRLNCLAVVECCYRVLPHMSRGSRVINLASIAGVVPQPGLSVYSATKGFVLDLSRTLDHELRGTGIHVTALCPKFMHTGFLDKPGNADVARGMTMIGFEPVERVVRVALRYAKAGRSLCIPAWDMKAVHVICKILPTTWVMYAEDFFEGTATARLV